MTRASDRPTGGPPHPLPPRAAAPVAGCGGPPGHGPQELTAALGARLPSPVQELADDRFTARGLRLLLKREDAIHPDLPRNKPTGVSGSDLGV
ncbi:hypothetical protein ACFV3R_13040 [Streptomyces sp. NPDC059740]|uniref:hypothetical protein n=1 Tax=Streptomyces sp. NPDC059740 TaxID=3346926 RepID=UPI0036559BFA